MQRGQSIPPGGNILEYCGRILVLFIWFDCFARHTEKDCDDLIESRGETDELWPGKGRAVLTPDAPRGLKTSYKERGHWRNRSEAGGRKQEWAD